jgi:ATP phosphoribosyltransferase regulatory subunit
MEVNMNFSEDVLKSQEKAMMNLRALYRRYGYAQYKMSKFEEYDLYVRNKSFLASDHIITFNDTNGRLMALKPDVTLSIVKNTKDCDVSLSKYFYNENVYRLSQTSHEFKERMQVGLECIGPIDLYSMSEVIMLADQSLKTISSSTSLDISHMGFLGGLLESLGLTGDQNAAIVRCISEKNAPEIEKLGAGYGLDRAATAKLAKLAALYGPVETAIPVLRELSCCGKTDEALEELERVYETVRALGAAGSIRLDFSIVNDMNYYNGIIFQGFVDGIPTHILSGGRYDNLMRQFGKKTGAIGFAVYIDLLERFEEEKRPYDVDVLLLYDASTDTTLLADAVQALARRHSVRAYQGEPAAIKYRQLMTLKNGRLETLESHD